MLNLLTNLRRHAAERALYRRTRDEIAAMPRSVAIDVGIFGEDAAKLAHKAVWG